MKNKLIIIVAIFLTFCINYSTAYAISVDDVDVNKEGSIKVILEYEGEYISGETLSIYNVAEITTENGFVEYNLTESFLESGIKIDSSNALSSEVADEVSKFIDDNKIDGVSSVSGNDGVISFENLKPGIYYIKHNSSDLYEINGFMAATPSLIEDEVIYNIDATPKTQIIKKETPTEETTTYTETTTTTTTTKLKVPQTGFEMWLVKLFSITGILCIVLGIMLLYLEKNEGYIYEA